MLKVIISVKFELISGSMISEVRSCFIRDFLVWNQNRFTIHVSVFFIGFRLDLWVWGKKGSVFGQKYVFFQKKG